MFLIGLSFVLIVGIAIWQVRMGAFSALITLILASLSAVIAFNYFEPLANAMFDWTDQKRHPMYMNAASLMLLFVVVQLALRFVFDLLVSNDVGFAMWPNRIGGGALGVLVGMVQVGVFMIALQMLPVSQSVFTYVPYKDDLTQKAGLLPFKPDRFVLGMVESFSKGGLGVGHPWSAEHDDFLKAQFARRNQGWDAQVDGDGFQTKPGRVDAPPDAMSLVATYKLAGTSLINDLPTSRDLNTGEYVVVRVEVSSDARDDADNWYRLVGTHFELTATVPNTFTGREERKRFYPIAFLTRDSKENRWSIITGDGHRNSSDNIAQPVQLVVEREHGGRNARPGNENSLTIDWVYFLPDGAKPQRVAFRGGNPARLPDLDTVKPGQPPLAGALER
jgi:uncharacterized membrane protein required for colicin V production